MADIIKYEVIFDDYKPQVSGGIKISCLDRIKESFGDSATPANGVQVVDQGQPAGIGTDVGFGMVVLKKASLLPHGIICLLLADGSPGQTPPPGLTNNAIEDALQAIVAEGGYEITDANALLLATEMFPAEQIVIDEVTYNVRAPKLVGGYLKRDIVEA